MPAVTRTGARRLVYGALVGTLVVTVAACGGSGDASAEPDILFVSSRDGDYAAFGMAATGEDEHRLTDEGRDGSTVESLQYQVEPAWSPNASEIAFVSAREGTFDIYVMSADGTNTRTLTSTRDEDRSPSWSPDGERIVFARSADGGHLWVMNADGSGARRVTDDPASESDPAWSPDGAAIAYARRTPGTEVSEIWLVDADGRNRRRLTRLDAEASGPTWSPDGSIVAFAANPSGGRYQIFTVGADGDGIRRVLVSPEDAFEPAFAPDGQSLAYSTGGAIHVVTGEGDDIEVTDPAGNDSSPAWRPGATTGEETG